MWACKTVRIVLCDFALIIELVDGTTTTAMVMIRQTITISAWALFIFFGGY